MDRSQGRIGGIVPGTAAAPATCHQTEMLFRIASKWLEKMFTTEAMTRMTTNSMNTRVSE